MGALAGCAGTGAGGGSDIVDTAVAAGSFTTLVAAVEAAGLVETLKGPGPFTVFAPTDDAFAALPAGTVESLLQPENRDQLVSILTYHVAPGLYPASSLIGTRGRVPTVQGQSLHIDGQGGGVTVEGIPVVTPDVTASNGIIHVISGVLLP
ncbi:MAG: fasciclin domain-containing protein [Pseudomonadota bacterium]